MAPSGLEAQTHRRAMAAARAGDFETAARLLEPLARGHADPYLLGDAAVCLNRIGRLDEAAALVASLPDRPDLPALFRLNRLYLLKAAGVLADFDPTWRHQDHDGAPTGPDPKVSVIVRAYNRPDFLAENLLSLRAQTFADFETIVVNDGGDPACEQVVAETAPPRARYLMTEHGGRVRAQNAGLELARGRYVTGLDDDDVAYPHHLETLVGYLESSDAAPIAYADYRLVKYRTTPDHGLAPFERRDVVAKAYKKGVLFETNPCTIMIMVRRDCYERVGRFIPALELAEDWEMWLRLAERFDLHHVPAVTAEVRERPGPANLTNRRLREKYYWDNLVLVMHRGLTPLSAPLGPELEPGYKKVLAALDRLLERFPDALTLINLRGLWTMRKPYAWLADHGRWFGELGEPELAAACYRMALRLGPFQPKLWAGVVKTL